jgi:AcrR family transcriptional regulator
MSEHLSDPGDPDVRSDPGGRAAVTRRALLAAARDVFTASGFTEASISDVVTKAGASVGSLYHHFGGKADLYLALYEDHASRQEARAAEAVAAARSDGVTDPVALFIAGGRAYLDYCWQERDLARLFLAGGGPPGFELFRRRRDRDWIRRNAQLLTPSSEAATSSTDVDPAEDVAAEALVLVLTTVMGAAGHEVSLADSETTARRLADEVLTLVARMGNAPILHGRG